PGGCSCRADHGCGTATAAVDLFAADADDRGDRQQQDLQVEPEREVLDVVVVPLDAICDRRLPTQPMDLRPAGDAAFDTMAGVVAVHVRGEVLDVLGPLRPGANEA